MHEIYILFLSQKKYKKTKNELLNRIIPSYASNRIKVVCLWQQGFIVHASQTVWYGCDMRLEVPEVINISSSD